MINIFNLVTEIKHFCSLLCLRWREAVQSPKHQTRCSSEHYCAERKVKGIHFWGGLWFDFLFNIWVIITQLIWISHKTKYKKWDYVASGFLFIKSTLFEKEHSHYFFFLCRLPVLYFSNFFFVLHFHFFWGGGGFFI